MSYFKNSLRTAHAVRALWHEHQPPERDGAAAALAKPEAGFSYPAEHGLELCEIMLGLPKRRPHHAAVHDGVHAAHPSDGVIRGDGLRHFPVAYYLFFGPGDFGFDVPADFFVVELHGVVFFNANERKFRLFLQKLNRFGLLKFHSVPNKRIGVSTVSKALSPVHEEIVPS